MSNKLIHESAINHFIKHQPPIGVFGDRLHGGHFPSIIEKTQKPIYNLIEHLKDKINEGGSAGSGGSIHTGGTLSNELQEPPENEKELYHYALNLSPQQFEMMRELSNQFLGAKPSPVWDDYSSEGGNLESDPEEYEKIIDMPNSHAAARMIEAGIGHGKGGGFAKAFKHVAKIGSKIYKAGRGVLQYVNRNKDLLLGLVPDEYRGAAEGFLETATRIDDAVNPLIEATIDAVKENASPEDRQKLKRLAEQSIDKAIETHLPKAQPYYKGAKEAYNVYQSGDKEKMKEYAINKGSELIDKHAPHLKPYAELGKDAYNTYQTSKRTINAN